VVAGQLSAAEARSLAVSHHGMSPALALLLDVSTWTTGGQSGAADGTQAAAGVLTSAGWRVATVRADTPLGAAWQRLHQAPTPTRFAGNTGDGGDAGHAPQEPREAVR
jgi:hypothetical protein